MANQEFKQAVAEAANKFKEIAKGPIGVLSHNDTDGVTSAAIISKALERLNLDFHLFFITRTEDILTLIEQKPYETFLLLDYGSKESEKLSKLNKQFFILDHHEATKFEAPNVTDVNPHFYGVDGARDVCAAGNSYLFAKALDENNKDLVYLALVGIKGDSQDPEKEGSINNEILKEAIETKTVEVERGFAFYGWGTRPIHKALEYSTDPFIPGISGSESSSVKFLQEIGVKLKKDDGTWKTLRDITEDEKKNLATALILRRQSLQENPEKIFQNKLFLSNFPIKELEEIEVMSTWINSCAKLEHFGLATGVALGDQKSYEEAEIHVRDYKKQIIQGMNFFFENRKNPEYVQENEDIILLTGKDKLNPHLAGTISTILSYNLEEKGKAMIVTAYLTDTIKVSGRYVASDKSKGIHLGKLFEAIAEELGGEGGGHDVAAGATIPKDKEEEFIQKLKEMFINPTQEVKIDKE